MTEEQFDALPEQLRIWALRENAVIYLEDTIILSPFMPVVKIALEKDKNYPHAIHKNQLKDYSQVWVDELHNIRQ